MSFVVLDFETANRARSSACEIGLVKIESGQIVDKFTTLIKPHREFDHFEEINVMIHGVSAQDVRNAPEINEVWQKIAEFIGEDPLVAHNAAFDIGVLRASAELYSLELPTTEVYCTLVLSRRILKLVSYSLPWVAEELGVDFEPSHRALEDAIGTSAVAHALLKRADLSSLKDLALAYRVAPGKLSPNFYSSTHSLGSSQQPFGSRTNLDRYVSGLEETDFVLDADFMGQEVIFTGKLMSMTREDAQKLVIRAGGTTGPGVTKRTSMLVFGQQDAAHLKPGSELSAKFEKALSLMQSGQAIEVIDEQTFLQLLD